MVARRQATVDKDEQILARLEDANAPHALALAEAQGRCHGGA
jgi:hypothetical protein